MRKKLVCGLLIMTLCIWAIGVILAASSESLTRGAASLLVPGLGQYINGELNSQQGRVKTGVMILLEIGAILTTSIVGGVVGYPQIWAGIGIFIFNHLWSASDAYMNAPAGPEVSFEQPATTER